MKSCFEKVLSSFWWGRQHLLLILANSSDIWHVPLGYLLCARPWGLSSEHIVKYPAFIKLMSFLREADKANEYIICWMVVGVTKKIKQGKGPNVGAGVRC